MRDTCQPRVQRVSESRKQTRRGYSLSRCIDGVEGGLSLANGRYAYVQVVGFPFWRHVDNYCYKETLEA